jgi:hypothetical protein
VDSPLDVPQRLKKEPRELVFLVQISMRNGAEENETVFLMQGKNHNKALFRTYKTSVIEPEIGHNSKRAETAQVQTRTDRVFSPREMPEWSESVKILSFLFPVIQKPWTEVRDQRSGSSKNSILREAQRPICSCEPRDRKPASIVA